MLPNTFAEFDPSDFSRRHIGPSPADMNEMLSTIGVADIDALISQAVPDTIRQAAPLALRAGVSEVEALQELRVIASKNKVLTSLIGQGYYGTFLPPVIQRNILENPAWYTAYTPYQPEISQGRLEALLNFQTMIADLCALEIANASLLDEATAAAEGMAMARRVAKSSANAFFVDAECHPQTIAVVRTRAEPLGWIIKVGDPTKDLEPAAVSGALVQYPGTSGEIRDFRAIISALHASGGTAVLATDPLALTLLVPPGELGADIAIGSTQRFGMPMGYGGPHAAFIATKDAYTRMLPGRIVGVSVDSRGQPAYRLPPPAPERHPAHPLRSAAAHPHHPPREGALKYLPRTSPPGGDRGDVCGLSRARRSQTHRRQSASHRRHIGRGTDRAWLARTATRILRHHY